MKKCRSAFYTLLFLFSFCSYGQTPNLLLVDSSFAPIKSGSFNLNKESCLLVSESTELAENSGECFGREDWAQLKENDTGILKGMMNTLAGVEGSDNGKWKVWNAQKAEDAKKMRNTYILLTHGSRASYIAYQYSGEKAEILPVRVVTSSAGETKQQPNSIGKKIKGVAHYSAECPLVNWPKKEVEQFIKKGKLQAYQRRLTEILTNNPSIKVISISLGYKKSWIQEDNAKCEAAFIDKEYQILVNSWASVLNKFKDRLFVVAAGNEGVSFDNTSDRDDDLWATLSEHENLLLVGSLKKNGERFPSSNYGKKVLMVKGEEIAVLSPLPNESEGYSTTVRGTSFSAPIVAGLAVKEVQSVPTLKINELRTILEKMVVEIK